MTNIEKLRIKAAALMASAIGLACLSGVAFFSGTWAAGVLFIIAALLFAAMSAARTVKADKELNDGQ